MYTPIHLYVYGVLISVVIRTDTVSIELARQAHPRETPLVRSLQIGSEFVVDGVRRSSGAKKVAALVVYH